MVEDNNPDPLLDTEAMDGAGAPDEAQALRAEVAALKEQALRYAAEAENTRRRAEREVNDARAFAIQRFGRDLLEAADNLSRALQASPKDAVEPALKNLVLGVEMTEKALQSAFERNGLKRVQPAKGEKFDPHKHQAVMEQPSDEVSAGGVIQVLQAGYELMGRLVRPAMVAVAAKGSKGPDAPAEPTAGAANPYAATGDTSGEAFDTKA